MEKYCSGHKVRSPVIRIELIGSFSANVLTPVPVPVTISPQVILIILECLTSPSSFFGSIAIPSVGSIFAS